LIGNSIIEGRRLTGANFFCDEPAAILESNLEPEKFEAFYLHWQNAIKTLHDLLDKPQPQFFHRRHAKGQSLIVTAPIDALYSTIELLEAVFTLFDELGYNEKLETKQLRLIADQFRDIYKQEQRPDIIHLRDQALEHKVPFLWDDDFLSLGYGKYSDTWPIDELPAKPNWGTYRAIPLAIITGTNGKSTTTRLCSQILKHGDMTVGFSSTDGIWAGEDCLDTGDYSGPGGAREVLRNKKIDVAILEVARGGLLRRGLGAENANVALITNVAEDHLGEWGINTLDELIEAKFIVRKAAKGEGHLILNADDQGCVNFAQNLDQTISWFSLNRNNPLIQQQIKNKATAFFADEGQLFAAFNGEVQAYCKIKDIPIGFNGAALHNISNALSASSLTYHLGVKLDTIRKGLCSFNGNEQNPGRGNIFNRQGVSIMVDFAHNPHGLNAVVNTLLQLPAKRRLVMLGHAGDRSNDDIDALTQSALKLNPDQIVIYEIADYLRGRELGEIPEIIRQSLKERGYPLDQVIFAESSVDGTKKALAWSEHGDFLLLLALSDREAVFALLKE